MNVTCWEVPIRIVNDPKGLFVDFVRAATDIPVNMVRCGPTDPQGWKCMKSCPVKAQHVYDTLVRLAGVYIEREPWTCIRIGNPVETTQVWGA